MIFLPLLLTYFYNFIYTADGRNPPVHRSFIQQFTYFFTSQVVSRISSINSMCPYVFFHSHLMNLTQVLYTIGLAIESTRQGRASSMPPPQRGCKFWKRRSPGMATIGCEVIVSDSWYYIIQFVWKGYRTINCRFVA